MVVCYTVNADTLYSKTHFFFSAYQSDTLDFNLFFCSNLSVASMSSTDSLVFILHVAANNTLLIRSLIISFSCWQFGVMDVFGLYSVVLSASTVSTLPLVGGITGDSDN